MNRTSTESAVERLIALASDDEKKPEATPEPEPAPEPAPAAVAEPEEEESQLEAIPVYSDGGMPELPSLAELEHNPVWKALVQFRALIPYVTRLLDMSSQIGGHAQPNSTALSNELKQIVGDLHTSHHDLRLAVQDQTVQMKRLEEELTRSREAAERNAYEQTEMVEDMKSIHTLARKATWIVISLVSVLILLVVWLLIRVPHLG